MFLYACLLLEIRCQSNFLFSRSAENVGPVFTLLVYRRMREVWNQDTANVL